ncbi:MAG: hypothetical protein E7Z93_08100 [Cyanobacteria bacterium SIG32]|nr:hypothetical protein [Cyanobacteria bacterium SIG32]
MKVMQRLRAGVANIFNSNKKSFKLDGDRSKMTRTHLTKSIGQVDYSVDEAVLGNKKHVIITKRDYSESPLITTTTRKEKGFENGKLVYTDTSINYDRQSLTEQIWDFLGHNRYYD